MPVMKMKSTGYANSDENMSKMGKGLNDLPSEYPTSNATLLVMPVGESEVEAVGDLVNSCAIIVGAANVKKGIRSSRPAAASATSFGHVVGIGSLGLR